jgi:broad specificity phosphatase PhoE
MHMNVYFVRHAPLKAPYDNYEALSLAELDRLATQEVDPPIQTSSIELPTELVDFLQQADSLDVLRADSRRARETCQLLLGSRVAPVTATDLLREMRFTPSKLVDQETYRQSGLELVRTNLFADGVGRAHASEPVELIYERIGKLGQLLGKLDCESVLCITHGFFMRYLQTYFVEGIKNSNQVTVALLEKQVNYPYLHGFKIELNT